MPGAAKTQLTPEELERKLKHINDTVATRFASNTGSTAGQGSGAHTTDLRAAVRGATRHQVQDPLVETRARPRPVFAHDICTAESCVVCGPEYGEIL